MGIADIVTPTASAVGASLIAYIGYRQSVKVERSRLEAGAFERARKIYEDSITELEERVQRLRTDLEEERTSKRQLLVRVSELELLVARMRRQITLAGIELTDPPPHEAAP